MTPSLGPPYAFGVALKKTKKKKKKERKINGIISLHKFDKFEKIWEEGDLDRAGLIFSCYFGN